MNEACWWPCGVFEPTCIGTRQDPNLFWSGVRQILVNRRRDQWELATNRSRQTIMRGKGLNWSGVDPPLSSSRACLTTFIAISVPWLSVSRRQCFAVRPVPRPWMG